jgi:hypothetical protein
MCGAAADGLSCVGGLPLYSREVNAMCRHEQRSAGIASSDGLVKGAGHLDLHVALVFAPYCRKSLIKHTIVW